MLRIEIATDNDAFVPNPYQELSRLVRGVADKMDNGCDGGNILDVNGNKVGRWDLLQDIQ